MQSVFLNNYLDNIGSTIHSLNTICVGLSNVANGAATKPDDLTITWKPKDPETSSIISRIFTIKSTYVFLAESTYQYMDCIKNVFYSGDSLDSYNKLKNCDKVEAIFKNAMVDELPYRIIMLKLLIHTRNKIVHKKSKTNLSSDEKIRIKENSEIIYKNHSGLIVDELLTQFTNN